MDDGKETKSSEGGGTKGAKWTAFTGTEMLIGLVIMGGYKNTPQNNFHEQRSNFYFSYSCKKRTVSSSSWCFSSFFLHTKWQFTSYLQTFRNVSSLTQSQRATTLKVIVYWLAVLCFYLFAYLLIFHTKNKGKKGKSSLQLTRNPGPWT